jgi:hypothetical protein
MTKQPSEEEPIPSVSETVRDIVGELAIWAVLVAAGLGIAVLFGVPAPFVAP